MLDKINSLMSLKNIEFILCYIFSAFYFEGNHSKKDLFGSFGWVFCIKHPRVQKYTTKNEKFLK